MRYFIIVTLLLISCRNPFESIEKIEPIWIAATARIDDYEQIVLINYNNSANYKLITNDQNSNFYPRFSPDRTKLVYLKEHPENTAGRRIVLYSLFNGEYSELIDSTFPAIYVVGDIPVVWSPDGTKIYARFRSYFFSDDPVFYDFANKKLQFLINTKFTSEYVVGFLGSDTLIVFSNDTSATHGPYGFYLMDLNGNYISYIDNPHLELININGVNRKAAYNPDWNNKLGLFVYAAKEPDVPGFKIAITDLKGTVYKTYTSGEYIDDYPVWGPEDHIVFFERKDRNDYNGFKKRLMVLNLKTGEVREFVNPVFISNATALGYPDY